MLHIENLRSSSIQVVWDTAVDGGTTEATRFELKHQNSVWDSAKLASCSWFKDMTLNIKNICCLKPTGQPFFLACFFDRNLLVGKYPPSEPAIWSSKTYQVITFSHFLPRPELLPEKRFLGGSGVEPKGFSMEDQLEQRGWLLESDIELKIPIVEFISYMSSTHGEYVWPSFEFLKRPQLTIVLFMCTHRFDDFGNGQIPCVTGHEPEYITRKQVSSMFDVRILKLSEVFSISHPSPRFVDENQSNETNTQQENTRNLVYICLYIVKGEISRRSQRSTSSQGSHPKIIWTKSKRRRWAPTFWDIGYDDGPQSLGVSTGASKLIGTTVCSSKKSVKPTVELWFSMDDFMETQDWPSRI